MPAKPPKMKSVFRRRPPRGAPAEMPLGDMAGAEWVSTKGKHDTLDEPPDARDLAIKNDADTRSAGKLLAGAKGRRGRRR
jgi:hypothetical protein